MATVSKESLMRDYTSRAPALPRFLASRGEVDVCVLLYSGGLDTSCMLKWIQEEYECEVISVTADVGQEKDFSFIEKKAKDLGVLRHYQIDAKREFAEGYIAKAIKANALYQGVYPVSSSLSRYLIAKLAVDVAEKEDADAVAHGCTGKGNDQVRFDVTLLTLAPDLKIISPVVQWNMNREQEYEYAKKHGIPLDFDSRYSIDENLWGRSIEGGDLELPEREPPEEVFYWTVAAEKAPETLDYVEIGFQEGIPVSVDGENMDLHGLTAHLNKRGGKNGVGRLDHMEDRVVGLKSREVYECPAATVLIRAHQDLEKAISTGRQLRVKKSVDEEWTNLVYGGLWVDPLRNDLESFIDSVNKNVDGSVTMKLYKGSAQVASRQAEGMLYDRRLATYGSESTFSQTSSFGFIELWGLQSRTAYQKHAAKEVHQT